MGRRRECYRVWRDSAPLHLLTRSEREERYAGEERERALSPQVRAALDAMVGYEIRLLRSCHAFDGGEYRRGMVFQALSRIEDRLVVRLAPTKEKQRSGKPQVPTVLLTLRLEWVESTGRVNGSSGIFQGESKESYDDGEKGSGDEEDLAPAEDRGSVCAVEA